MSAYKNKLINGTSVINNFGWCKLGTKTASAGSLFVLPNIYKTIKSYLYVKTK